MLTICRGCYHGCDSHAERDERGESELHDEDDLAVSSNGSEARSGDFQLSGHPGFLLPFITDTQREDLTERGPSR